MKKKERRNLLLLIIVAVIIIAILVGVKNSKQKELEQYGAGNQDQAQEQGETENQQVGEYEKLLEDGTKINTSEELKKDKEIEGIKISNIQLTQQNGQTVLLADVTNPGETATDVIGIKIIVLDKEGNEIGQIPGAVSPLKPGETKQLNTGITESYSNAYDFRVEKQ